MKNKKANKFPEIKKDLKVFLESEEGKIVEKKAVKLASAIVASGVFLAGVMTPVDTAHGAEHCAHASHASHGSHGSHGRGGWCW